MDEECSPSSPPLPLAAAQLNKLQAQCSIEFHWLCAAVIVAVTARASVAAHRIVGSAKRRNKLNCATNYTYTRLYYFHFSLIYCWWWCCKITQNCYFPCQRLSLPPYTLRQTLMMMMLTTAMVELKQTGTPFSFLVNATPMSAAAAAGHNKTFLNNVYCGY